MTKPIDHLISLLEVGAVTSKEDFDAAVDAAFADEVPVLSTINSIANSDGFGTQITLKPVTWNNEQMWELYIPPTTRDAFYPEKDPETGEYPDDDFDPLENSIIGPWGETYWPTLAGAIACLSIAQKHGNVRFNDGRIAL